MEISLLFALKKVLGGIVAIFLIAGIMKGKSLFIIDTIRKHIKNEIKRDPNKARRLYGNDYNEYISQNYPDKDSFFQLIMLNAFRPLLVLILISVLDFHNTFIILFEIFLVILIFPIEIYFGENWKDKKWYKFIIIFMWLLAFFILTYSSYLQNQFQNEIKSFQVQSSSKNKSDNQDTTINYTK